MKVNVYLREMSTRPGPSDEMLSFVAGLKRHGVDPRVLSIGRPEECDLAVVWGAKRRREMASGRRVLVLERGYVGDRLAKWTSAGFDGLNGRADFMTDGIVSAERWKEHHAGVMKPWRAPNPKGYVLILGQVPGDAALAGINFGRWVRELAEALILKGERVAYRSHPNFRTSCHVPGVKNLDGSFDEALAGAKRVVSFNSNGSVLSVLEGVPTVTVDQGAMAWDVTGHDPMTQPEAEDRALWAARLAWCQWTAAEMESGETWAYLKEGME